MLKINCPCMIGLIGGRYCGTAFARREKICNAHGLADRGDPRNLPTRRLKYRLQGTINGKNLRENSFHVPTGG